MIVRVLERRVTRRTGEFSCNARAFSCKGSPAGKWTPKAVPPYRVLSWTILSVNILSGHSSTNDELGKYTDGCSPPGKAGQENSCGILRDWRAWAHRLKADPRHVFPGAAGCRKDHPPRRRLRLSDRGLAARGKTGTGAA